MNIKNRRSDFRQLQIKINNHSLVYFDNAATTLKPQVMVDAIADYYAHQVANVHRGVHTLSEVGTVHFEETRVAVQELINAPHPEEIIFTKGTTDSLNLLAQCFGKKFITKGDEILISLMEHHSNIVPWQMIAETTGAKLIVAPIDDKGDIDLESFKKLLNNKTKIVSIAHVSNTLGTINPIKEMIKEAHAVGAKFCVDAAQSVAHMPIDVQDLDCDFLVFSAHKVFGPNGLGFLYGKKELLDQMPPYQGGGSMISEVTFDKTTYAGLPNKFEAGTPAIAEIIVFKKSIEYIKAIGFSEIEKYEHELLEYATSELKKISGIRIIGEALKKSAVISFLLEGVHVFDLGTILDKEGIAIRTGQHCTQPLLKRFHCQALASASFAFYNTKEEIDLFTLAIKKARDFLL